MITLQPLGDAVINVGDREVRPTSLVFILHCEGPMKSSPAVLAPILRRSFAVLAPFLRRSRAGLSVAGVALLLVACRDTATVAPPESAHLPPSLMVTDLQVDVGDTWLSAEITTQTTTTVYTDQPITNPVTGESMTSITTASPPEVVNLYGGFDASGQLQASIIAAPDPDRNADLGSQVTVTRILGDHVEYYDALGRRVSEYASDGAILPQLTTEDLWIGGSMTDGSIVDDPSALQQELQGTEPAYLRATGAAGADLLNAVAAVAAAIRYRVEQPDPSTLLVVQDVDDDAAPAMRSVSGAAASQAQQGTTKVTRTYRRHGKNKEFVIDEIRADREQRVGESRTVMQHVLKYRNVKWNKHKEKDNARKAKAARDRTDRSERPPRRQPAPPPSSIVVDGGGFIPNVGTPTGDNYCNGQFAPERNVITSGTGRHLVVQHGFSESGCLYRVGRTRSDLKSAFLFDDDFMPTLDYGARIPDQARTLASKVNAVRGDNQASIFIGYSNGGLVARQVAQWNASRVAGVVTISTPNNGIPVVKLGYYAVATLLSPVIGGAKLGCQWFGVFCGFDSITDWLGKLASWFGIGGDGRPTPVLADVIESGGNWYINDLNAANENFNRVGILQMPRQRWLFRRAGAAGSCGTALFIPCGRASVSGMDNYYAHLRATTIVHGTWNPFKLAARILRATRAGAVMAYYNGVDGTFNFLLAPQLGDGSDGLVPFSSQRYPRPSVPDNEILQADAHAEAFGSDLVSQTALGSVLAGRPFEVRPRR